MLSAYWLAAPFILQMLCMAADELVFHRRRGLPRWERIGHPLDTLTVALCLGWVLAVRPGPTAFSGFVALAIFSCAFVTKDELVHSEHCSAGEQWLHSVLFMLHPLVLASAGLLWPSLHRDSSVSLGTVLQYTGFEYAFLSAACLLMLGFAAYQLVFWNLLWHPKIQIR